MSSSVVVSPDPPPPDLIPKDVEEAFELLRAALTSGHPAVLMRVRTGNGKPSHFLVAVLNSDGDLAVPVAIIPSGISVHQYLVNHDAMSAKFGGAEQDPEFKGVRQ